MIFITYQNVLVFEVSNKNYFTELWSEYIVERNRYSKNRGFICHLNRLKSASLWLKYVRFMLSRWPVEYRIL